MVVHTDSRARAHEPPARARAARLVGRPLDWLPMRWRTSSATTRSPSASAPDAATVAQDVKIDNDLYVRDYSRCILCYKCVEACGEDHQNTFAIAVAGRGFDAHISTELDVTLPESACVYCGNCIAVCPTGALMSKSEYDMPPGRHLGREQRGGRDDDLPVLRRRLQPRAARAGGRDRQRHARPTTTTSRAATSASRAASATSSSRTASEVTRSRSSTGRRSRRSCGRPARTERRSRASCPTGSSRRSTAWRWSKACRERRVPRAVAVGGSGGARGRGERRARRGRGRTDRPAVPKRIGGVNVDSDRCGSESSPAAATAPA